MYSSPHEGYVMLVPWPQGFWRNWHASFNLWLVRYLYIPLGGSHRRALAVWPIFTFVAVWHDLEWRLLAWAWLSSLLFAPELVHYLPLPFDQTSEEHLKSPLPGNVCQCHESLLSRWVMAYWNLLSGQIC